MAEADDTVRVKFLRDEVYETEGRNQGKRFAAGRVYSLTPDMAQRWVRRNSAELVDEPAEDEGEEPPKPRRGRPPKAKAGEAGNGDETDEDDEPEPAPPAPPRPPASPVRSTPPESPAKPPETGPGPGPKHVESPILPQPTKAPDKGR